MRPLIILLAAWPLLGAPAVLSPTEVAIVRLLNEARTSPARFAQRYLASRARQSRDAAECFREMSRAAPLPPFSVAVPLVSSARDHAGDLGTSGQTGHVGADGSTLDDRINRHAEWDGNISENLYYGPADAVEIVIELLIDEGVPGRGHRRNILSAKMAAVGIAVRRHARYGSICVMDFASSLRPRLQGRGGG